MNIIILSIGLLLFMSFILIIISLKKILKIRKYKENQDSFITIKANLINIERKASKYGYIYRGLYNFVDYFKLSHEFYDLYKQSEKLVKKEIDIYCSTEDSNIFLTDSFIKSEKLNILILIIGISLLVIFYHLINLIYII